MLHEMHHSPPGMLHDMQHRRSDVASRATRADEGTRGIDDRTRGKGEGTHRNDDRTRLLADESGTGQTVETTAVSAVLRTFRPDEQTGEARIAEGTGAALAFVVGLC